MRITEYHACTRNQRRKMFKECLVLVLSKRLSCRGVVCIVADLTFCLGAFLGSRGNIWCELCYRSPQNLFISFQVMQSQMIGMQSSLDRILSAVQTQQSNTAMAQQPMYSNGSGPRDAPGFLPPHRNGFEMGQGQNERTRSFPPLPGFAPPVSELFTI